MGREVVYCRLWTFHFCGLFVDPELLSQTGSRQRGVGRTQKFPILPSLSPSSIFPPSIQSPAQQSIASGAASNRAFCAVLKMLMISRAFIFGGNPRVGGRWELLGWVWYWISVELCWALCCKLESDGRMCDENYKVRVPCSTPLAADMVWDQVWEADTELLRTLDISNVWTGMSH